MTLRSDQDLLEAALGQDLGAFDEFMQRYERLVVKVAFQFVHDPDAAFDVAQTVFLKAFQGLGHFRHEAKAKTWLLRITCNESLDWLRRGRAQRLAHGPMEELPVEPSQEHEAFHLEDRARVTQALTGLNERHRLAVILRYFQGLGIAEIAQVLGCSQGVTKNMLFRGVRALRATLTRI